MLKIVWYGLKLQIEHQAELGHLHGFRRHYLKNLKSNLKVISSTILTRNGSWKCQKFKKWYQISYFNYSSDNFDPQWPCVDLSCKLISHYFWAIWYGSWYGNSLFRYSLEIKNPLRHSRSPQNRYNIPVKGISRTSSVILSSTETYRLQAHFFIWKNQLQKTEPGLLGRLFGCVCPFACDRNVFWDWENYPEMGDCHVICFIMRRKAFFWLSFGRGHPSTKNVIFLAISWFKSRSADHLIDNLCL